jgi:2Fe-2S ferredoxin
MINITYIEHDGTEHAVDAPVGASLMEVAKNKLIPGIEADCGGACACATCHVFFDDDQAKLVGSPSEQEESMLEVVDERRPTSRLSCQVRVTELFDGLNVRMPESQR